MKIKSLLFIVVFISCAFSNVHPAKPIKTSPTIDGLYKFTGKLNGKYTVFLWFVVKDSVLKGEVTYLKTAKREPITIIGEIKKDWGMTIYEFASKGKITGIFSGPFKPNGLIGTWSAPVTDKKFNYTLIPKDTTLAPVDMTLKPTLVNGQYEYHFGKNGADGVVDLKHIDAENYLVDINCVGTPPNYGVADVETLKAKMYNNAILFNAPGTKCVFKIKAFNNFVVVDLITRGVDPGFGAGASVDGIFIKTSDIASVR